MPRRAPIKPMKFPSYQEKQYRSLLLAYNRTYKYALKTHLSPVVPRMVEEATAIHLPTGEIRQDAGWRETLDNAMTRISRDMAGPQKRTIKQLDKLARENNQHNKAEWQRLVRSQYGVAPTKENPDKYEALMQNWARNNSLLIKDIPAKTSRQIADRISSALINGTEPKQTTKEVFDIMSERTDVSDSRAILIARDQTAKLNGQFTRERQEDLGVEGYIWRTVGDERVRDTHEENDGEFFSWDNPPGETGHPGEDVQCRCWAEPVLPEFVAYEASLLEEV